MVGVATCVDFGFGVRLIFAGVGLCRGWFGGDCWLGFYELIVFILLLAGLMVLYFVTIEFGWVVGGYGGVCSLLLMFWFRFGVFSFCGCVGWVVVMLFVCVAFVKCLVCVMLLCVFVFPVLVCWWLYLIAVNSVVIVYFMLCYDY